MAAPAVRMEGILAAPTPEAWVAAAVSRWPEVLVDHANCEKKAASTALALIFAYPEDVRLTAALSRLAREELRHFEQVQRAMTALDVPFVRQRPGRYGSGLRAHVRTSETGRKLDLLLVGALIEARSCERFRLLAPRLQAPLGSFYGQLSQSEARHFELYVDFARSMAPDEWRSRLAWLAAREAELVTEPDDDLRFHSGPPRVGPLGPPTGVQAA
jgi:tRNA-(ms[2]io[6]A)-hydroxylase